MAAARVRVRAPSARAEAAFLAAARVSRGLHRPWIDAPGRSAAFRAWVTRFQSAYLGYYAFAAHAGTGLMREGFRLVLRELFGRHRLHRVEANIQPENLRSRAFVEGLGFRLEGYSPRYLEIGGRWRDHERWALLAEESRGRR
jgi:ribosomal-protein-alanine N-acetyltransferase